MDNPAREIQIMQKSFLSGFVAFCWLLVFLAGCATAPHNEIPSEDAQTQTGLSHAASQFQAPNPPKTLNVADEAQVEWHADKSMKITVHQVWAARVKPEHPLPPIATLNQDCQTLSVQTLQLYDLDEKGNFQKSQAKAGIKWTPPEENLPTSLSKITSARLPELNAGQALDLKYTLETKTSTLLAGKENTKEAFVTFVVK